MRSVDGAAILFNIEGRTTNCSAAASCITVGVPLSKIFLREDLMTPRFSSLRMAAFAACASTMVATAPASAVPVAEFYDGKQITFLVVSGSGGMNGLYARTLGDRMGKYVPGKPKFIYQYMPGGGGLKGTNYLYNVAPRNGTMLGQVLNPHPLMQILRPEGVKYDAARFQYIGNTGDQNGSIAVWHTVPAKTLMDLKNVEVNFAGTGKGSESYYDPTLLNSLFGTRIKMVMGYKGGGQLDLAMEQQETLGRAGPLISWMVRKPHWLKDGKIRLLAQVGLKKVPGYEDVPLLLEFARNEEERQIIKLISSRSALGRPVAAPPGVPRARIEALRKAFVDTMNDPDFQADIKKRRMLNDWRSGEEVQKIVAETLATPKPMIDTVKKALGWAK